MTTNLDHFYSEKSIDDWKPSQNNMFFYQIYGLNLQANKPISELVPTDAAGSVDLTVEFRVIVLAHDVLLFCGAGNPAGSLVD